MNTDVDRVFTQIDKEELASLALALGNIDSPAGREKEVGQFVESWLEQEGFQTRTTSLFEDRPNVIGVYKGTGDGFTLLFNSHMDTAISDEDVWAYRNCTDAIYHQAWREEDILYGEAIVNDKGPMACFLIAAKAIKKAGISLKGDLLLTGASGEIAWEPMGKLEGIHHPGRAVGVRWMVTHGVLADYALVAEATNFRYAWVEAGELFIRITVFGNIPVYTPYLKPPYAPEENPNAIIRISKLIEAIDQWALTYEQKHVYVCPGGTLIPKVAVAAIRGGSLDRIPRTSELCALYVNVMTAPEQDMLAIKRELEELLCFLKLPGEVEIFVSRHGHVAKNIDPLADSLKRAHQKVFNKVPEPATGPECSMWRDVNVFNEFGIPCLTYGPATASGAGNRAVHLDDLYKAAQVYAAVALDLCNQEKKP